MFKIQVDFPTTYRTAETAKKAADDDLPSPCSLPYQYLYTFWIFQITNAESKVLEFINKAELDAAL